MKPAVWQLSKNLSIATETGAKVTNKEAAASPFYE